MKATRLFIFNDNTMQSLAPAPVFTDGINIYVHERVANETWSLHHERELDAFRPIWQALMRSVEWVMKEGGEQADPQWKTIELVPFQEWVVKLQKYKAVSWLEKLGMNLKTTPGEMQAMLSSRKDVLNILIAKQQQENEDPQVTPAPALKNPVWLNEIDRIVRQRWDDCIWNWEEKRPYNYQRWTVSWMLAERMGALIGEARNEMSERGSENRIIKEGWGAAMSGWTQTLKAMLIAGDWVSFGRSILSFVHTCNQKETLNFDEKTDITGVAAQVLEELSFKMAWVDLLSGSYEFFTLNKVIKQDMERFWSTYQKGAASVEEGIAFYSLIPESPSQVAFKKEYINMFFHDLLENVDAGQNQESILKEGFEMLVQVSRGVSAEDALSLMERWREWAEDQAPEWFDDDEFDEGEAIDKTLLRKMASEMTRARRWTVEQKRRIEQEMAL
jgi:hypothetical protein